MLHRLRGAPALAQGLLALLQALVVLLKLGLELYSSMSLRCWYCSPMPRMLKGHNSLRKGMVPWSHSSIVLGGYLLDF